MSSLRAPRSRVAVIGLYTLPFLALLFSFAGGYVLGQVDALSGVRPLPSVLRRAGLERVAEQIPVAAVGSAALSDEDRALFHVLWESWGLVNREFYEPQRLDHQRMVYGAVRGMLETLDDPATLFMDPVHGALADADLRGTFDGIGVQVDERDGKLVIIAPLEGSPGERAGLKPGDVITTADGTDLAGMDLTQAVALIRGPRGTSVTLTVQREGTPEPLTFSIQRDEIRVDSVRSRMLEDGVGYLRISTFSSETGSETQRALTTLLEQKPRGIVLDVRSNPGGYVTSAVEVVSQFVSDGVVLHQESARGQRETIRTSGGGIATEIPVVVLVDGGSASASEIVAAALRDNGRATLVGEKTFGKGTVQTVHELGDRSSLRVTMAQWLTPNGEPLHGQGLVPDLVVGVPEDIVEGQDPQLEAAAARIRDRANASTPAVTGSSAILELGSTRGLVHGPGITSAASYG